ENILKICYRNANPEISAERLPRVRVYDLRHRFASATLCRWLDEGKNLYNMLPYLRTYMGHKSLSQTAYYIHILPENLLKSCSIDWSKLDNIIPEDNIWDE
ncbi:MAG: integrase, partial [Clostridia bacterium]|nr:integrase [Clostridia bacterium]